MVLNALLKSYILCQKFSNPPIWQTCEKEDVNFFRHNLFLVNSWCLLGISYFFSKYIPQTAEIVLVNSAQVPDLWFLECILVSSMKICLFYFLQFLFLYTREPLRLQKATLQRYLQMLLMSEDITHPNLKW